MRTYADLKAIVDAVASPLQVTVAGVVFTSASSADTEYTVKGSVSGSFAALASKSAATGGREIQFNLTWTGEQRLGLRMRDSAGYHVHREVQGRPGRADQAD